MSDSISVVQGEDRTLSLQVTKFDGTSYDLTAITEITAKFSNADGSVLTKTKTDGSIVITDAKAGRYTVTLTETETAALKYLSTLIGQDFTVMFDTGSSPAGERRIVNYTKGLKVIKESV